MPRKSFRQSQIVTSTTTPGSFRRKLHSVSMNNSRSLSEKRQIKSSLLCGRQCLPKAQLRISRRELFKHGGSAKRDGTTGLFSLCLSKIGGCEFSLDTGWRAPSQISHATRSYVTVSRHVSETVTTKAVWGQELTLSAKRFAVNTRELEKRPSKGAATRAIHSAACFSSSFLSSC
jgi:hypothetical protein